MAGVWKLYKINMKGLENLEQRRRAVWVSTVCDTSCVTLKTYYLMKWDFANKQEDVFLSNCVGIKCLHSKWYLNDIKICLLQSIPLVYLSQSYTLWLTVGVVSSRTIFHLYFIYFRKHGRDRNKSPLSAKWSLCPHHTHGVLNLTHAVSQIYHGVIHTQISITTHITQSINQSIL